MSMSCCLSNDPSSSWLPKTIAYGTLDRSKMSHTFKIVVSESGESSPNTWSPVITTRSGFSSSSTVSTNSVVLRSASQYSPEDSFGHGSKHTPSSVEKCRSATWRILNLFCLLNASCGLEGDLTVFL
ncbi:hypothetical protein OGAPHI_003840 [Ogataea philodendri]|uniref:Uncharacterized protein n=1 Tax=Ogataea philodendri TaxID=1378263 RepID=A0A9P8P666_9ASCO|nr:uncharacterized protein OGAPHI_003840 [Ogataea philodendri]KAH3665652.1 hypothetical protein OGAPHI_003840 [Ogataea philodendri]